MAYGKNGATCRLETGGMVGSQARRNISQAPAGYTAHASVMEYIPSESSVHAVQDLVVEPASMEHISPAHAVYAAFLLCDGVRLCGV